MPASAGGAFIDRIRLWLEQWGYQYLEVPSLAREGLFKSCTEGTENRYFQVGNELVLAPEVTRYIQTAGAQRIGSAKVYYVTRCYRDESTTDSERLREFTQIGIECLGANSLDCRKVARRDAIRLFQELLPKGGWTLTDDVPRGLNLYDESGKTFEILADANRKQLLGGGPYDGGAGWALGLERLMLLMERSIMN